MLPGSFRALFFNSLFAFAVFGKITAGWNHASTAGYRYRKAVPSLDADQTFVSPISYTKIISLKPVSLRQ
jgi:hypothetical protein